MGRPNKWLVYEKLLTTVIFFYFFIFPELLTVITQINILQLD
jgi:hypothetical protein